MPFTQAVVQLGHHGYNAPKACANEQNQYPNCGNGTWHWSDVSLSAATPFTLIHPTSPVYTTGTSTVTFQQPAPAGAVLLFQAIGGALINGQPAPMQTTTTGQGACDHARSYFMPIAAGTTSVTVSNGGGGACIGFYARDFSIVSPAAPTGGTAPTPAPATPTSAPATPTSAPAPATPTSA